MSNQTPTPPNTNTNGLAYALLAVAAAVIVGLVILTFAGKDVDRFIQFATFLVPLLIMQIWTASKVNVVQQQVNGNLTQRLTNVANDIKEHVTATALPVETPAVNTTPTTTTASVDAGAR